MLEYLPIGHGSKDGSSRYSMRINVLRYLINHHSDGSWFTARDVSHFCRDMPSYAISTRHIANPRVCQFLYRLNRNHKCFKAWQTSGKYRITDLHKVKIILCEAERTHGIQESFQILPPIKRVYGELALAKLRSEKRMAREKKAQERSNPLAWIGALDSVIMNLGR